MHVCEVELADARLGELPHASERHACPGAAKQAKSDASLLEATSEGGLGPY